MKIVAVIQARRGSTRLPDKVLADVAGKMLVAHVIERAKLVEGVDQVAVATTTLASDDALVRVCKALDVAVVRGDAQDVLGRYARAARALDADAVVRLTADCPLLDPAVSAAVVKRFRDARALAGLHYASNVFPERTYPDGLDTEVFTREALERAAKEARSATDREHVTTWMQRKFGAMVASVSFAVDLSGVRWTVDTAEDLERVRAIYAALIQRALDGQSTPETMYSMAETMAAQLAATEAKTL